MHKLYLDTETYSEVDLRTAGTYRYAESAEIMMIQWAVDDGPVHVWDHHDGIPAPDLVALTQGADVSVIAHNAMFDRNVLSRGNLQMGIPIEKWRCTMVQALQHALPGALDPLGVVLGLPQDQQKNKEGKALIQKFCKPHNNRVNVRREALHVIPLASDKDIGTRVYFGADVVKAVQGENHGILTCIDSSKAKPYNVNDRWRGSARCYMAVSEAMEIPADEIRIDQLRYTRETHPDHWARFVEYGKQDIVALREVHRRLPTWNWQPDDVAMWHLDQKINDRGFAVDMELAHAGAAAAIVEKETLARRFDELTNGLKPTQRARVQEFINATYGLSIDSTAKHILVPLLDDANTPASLKEMATIMLSANKTSTAKYGAIAAAASTDGRFRGGLQFAGASRTRRWAGRGFQPQNLPSRGLPCGDLIELYIAALKAGVHQEVFDDLMLYGSAALRGVVTV